MIFFPGNMGMWEFANDMPCNLAPEQPAGIFGGLVRERIEFGACDIGNSIEPVADEIEHPRQIGAECMLSRIGAKCIAAADIRSEEHTSELQSLMRISYAVFCLKTTTHKYSKQYH